MNIDLTASGQPTIGSVRALIASKNDSENRQLRITKDGVAYLSDVTGNNDVENLHCRFETWQAGNGYCGIEAAADDKWVKEVVSWLKENWPEAKDTYVDW